MKKYFIVLMLGGLALVVLGCFKSDSGDTGQSKAQAATESTSLPVSLMTDAQKQEAGAEYYKQYLESEIKALSPIGGFNDWYVQSKDIIENLKAIYPNWFTKPDYGMERIALQKIEKDKVELKKLFKDEKSANAAIAQILVPVEREVRIFGSTRTVSEK